jgi:hypothetical protein
MDKSDIEFLNFILAELEHAEVLIDHWGCYADKYFQDKYSLQEDIDRYTKTVTLMKRFIKKVEQKNEKH